MKFERLRPTEHQFQKHEWLGEIPNHWKIQPLKTVTQLVNRGNSPEYVDESSVKVINQACIQWSGLNLENIKFQKDQDVSQWKGLLFPGDLLINSTGTGTLGRLALFKEQGNFIADGHVTIIRVNHQIVDYRYLYYLLQTSLYQGFIYNTIVSGSTNQIELSRDGLRNLPIIIPRYPEQHAIADFLDRETGRIDVLIDKKQRLLDLLAEKRSVLIDHTVLNGLNHNIKKKQSDSEWIGEIPEHWRTTRSKWLFALRNKKALETEKQLTVSQELGVVTQDEFMAHEGRRVVQVIKGADILKHVEPNDFIISMRSFQGGIEWSKIGGSTSSAYVVLIPSSQIYPPYFSYLLKCKKYIQALQSTSNLIRDGQALRYTNFCLVDLPVVPFEEQKAIAEFLSRENVKIDALINKVGNFINRLREYRATLISAAIKGKFQIPVDS